MNATQRRHGRIQSAVEARTKRGQTAFVPYLCAGDPNLPTTERLVRALAELGADVIELGVPFSDPVADGPTNQRAAERALAAGTTLDRILTALATWRATGFDTPVVLFTYANPLVRMGYAAFVQRAVEAGVDGVLVVDLPAEEAEGAYIEAMRAADLDTVFLAAPTTSPERLRRTAALTRGFLYYVSRLGVTGAQQDLAEGLRERLQALRPHVPGPIAVGFGIRSAEQAAALRGLADAVVVGSALVELVESGGAPAGTGARGEAERADGAVGAVRKLAGELCAALHSEGTV